MAATFAIKFSARLVGYILGKCEKTNFQGAMFRAKYLTIPALLSRANIHCNRAIGIQ